ncbi:hypothetical protein [Streptomyces sp. c-19]|uniref:hypothetical protein n=1 Tax=Streptomyces sp. c-19 TaxID=2789275 RepID=UPI0039809943
MTRRTGHVVLAFALAAGVLTGCATTGRGTEAGRATPPVRATSAAPAAPTAPSDRATPAVRTMLFDLYTHCGIDEARIGSTYFEAETPLSDGSGNPPDGWGNPYQRGTMTLKSATEAVFTDDAGHEVRFRARPGATAPKHMCA